MICKECGCVNKNNKNKCEQCGASLVNRKIPIRIDEITYSQKLVALIVLVIIILFVPVFGGRDTSDSVDTKTDNGTQIYMEQEEQIRRLSDLHKIEFSRIETHDSIIDSLGNSYSEVISLNTNSYSSDDCYVLYNLDKEYAEVEFCISCADSSDMDTRVYFCAGVDGNSYPIFETTVNRMTEPITVKLDVRGKKTLELYACDLETGSASVIVSGGVLTKATEEEKCYETNEDKRESLAYKKMVEKSTGVRHILEAYDVIGQQHFHAIQFYDMDGAYVRYYLNNEYEVLSGYFSMVSGADADKTVTIYLDDEVVFEQCIEAGKEPVPINIDVSGKKYLEIRTARGLSDRLYLLDAFLLKSVGNN